MLRRFQSVPEWAWLTLAFALRAIFALKLDGRMVQLDENAYDAAAWSVASSGSFGPPGTVIAPLPPLFFSLFYLAGHYPVLARLGQGAVSTATAWALGRATREWTGSELAGRLALALAAVYPFFVYYSGTLLTESLYLACLVAGFLELGRAVRAPRGDPRSAAKAGLWLGVAALARAEGAFIWAVLWALAALAAARRVWPWRAWAVGVACWALPILGWCARNRAVAGRFALDLHGGATLLHGTRYFELNEMDTAYAEAALQREPWYAETNALPDAERDEALRAKAFEYMKEDPWRMFSQWRRKFVNFWRFYPRTDKIYADDDRSRPAAGAKRWALTAVSLLFEPWLILGGWAGLLLLASKDPRAFALPLFILGTLGIHLISVSQMRYRLPAMPWLILGLAWLAATRLERKSAR